ncbi:MAG: tetratricopeptide repeat protein, partial [Alphaproteobacteria bacterium]
MFVPPRRHGALVIALILLPVAAAPVGAGELARLLDRAATALDTGDDPRARALLERASAVDGGDARVFLALARLELRQGDLRAADATVHKALALEPDHA